MEIMEAMKFQRPMLYRYNLPQKKDFWRLTNVHVSIYAW